MGYDNVHTVTKSRNSIIELEIAMISGLYYGVPFMSKLTLLHDLLNKA